MWYLYLFKHLISILSSLDLKPFLRQLQRAIRVSLWLKHNEEEDNWTGKFVWCTVRGGMQIRNETANDNEAFLLEDISNWWKIARYALPETYFELQASWNPATLFSHFGTHGQLIHCSHCRLSDGWFWKFTKRVRRATSSLTAGKQLSDAVRRSKRHIVWIMERL